MGLPKMKDGMPRRIVCALLIVFAALPAAVAAAESAQGAAQPPLNISQALFAELTDNVDHPFAQVHLFTVGGFTLTISITKHFLLMALVAILVIATMLYLARKLRDPYKKPTRLQSLFETILEYMRREVFEPVLGDEGRRFQLLCFSFFLFILYSNLLGLVPPFAPVMPPGGDERVWIGGAVTGNLATTAGLGLITFIVFNVAGMRAKGILGYWKDLVPHGTPGWMAPVTLLFEIIGIFSKTFALIMRLFANMIGGHVAILIILILIIKFQSIFIGPAAIVVDLAISALEIFVAVLQAYIFSFLSALFIGLAMRKH